MKPKLLLSTFVIFSCISCVVNSKRLVGTYHDQQYKDTLIINQDQSFEYRETLWNNTVGWTIGKWKIDRRVVNFTCKREPLVGLTLKTRKDTTIRNFQLKFLLADKETPIAIKSVDLYQNKVKLINENNQLFSVSGNIIKVFSEDYDSLVLKTYNYIPISIRNNLNRQYGYNLRIYPSERLYDLDKFPFRFKNNKLASKTVRNKENGALRFVKLSS